MYFSQNNVFLYFYPFFRGLSIPIPCRRKGGGFDGVKSIPIRCSRMGMTACRKSFFSPLSLPSIDKGKYACQRVFPALFALFVLAGASPPASQKPKITRKSMAGRCPAVLPEQKCAQTRKERPAGNTAVFSRGLTRYGDISARQNRVCPCQSMVPYGVQQGV